MTAKPADEATPHRFIHCPAPSRCKSPTCRSPWTSQALSHAKAAKRFLATNHNRKTPYPSAIRSRTKMTKLELLINFRSARLPCAKQMSVSELVPSATAALVAGNSNIRVRLLTKCTRWYGKTIDNVLYTTNSTNYILHSPQSFKINTGPP